MSETHLHSSHPGFCGSAQMGRRFTFDADQATCESCVKNARWAETLGVFEEIQESAA